MNKVKGRGMMNFSYGNDKRSDVKSTTTIMAIINGERTATTRYEYQKNIGYWSKFVEGDIIEFISDDTKVWVKVTKPLRKLDKNTDPETWSKKEGWSVEYFNKKVKPKLEQAYQLEYEFLEERTSEISNQPRSRLLEMYYERNS